MSIDMKAFHDIEITIHFDVMETEFHVTNVAELCLSFWRFQIHHYVNKSILHYTSDTK